MISGSAEDVGLVEVLNDRLAVGPRWPRSRPILLAAVRVLGRRRQPEEAQLPDLHAGPQLDRQRPTLASSSVTSPKNPGSMNPAVEWVIRPRRPRLTCPRAVRRRRRAGHGLVGGLQHELPRVQAERLTLLHLDQAGEVGCSRGVDHQDFGVEEPEQPVTRTSTLDGWSTPGGTAPAPPAWSRARSGCRGRRAAPRAGYRNHEVRPTTGWDREFRRCTAGSRDDEQPSRPTAPRPQAGPAAGAPVPRASPNKEKPDDPRRLTGMLLGSLRHHPDGRRPRMTAAPPGRGRAGRRVQLRYADRRAASGDPGSSHAGVWNGRTSASQADSASSISVTRSEHITASGRLALARSRRQRMSTSMRRWVFARHADPFSA